MWRQVMVGGLVGLLVIACGGQSQQQPAQADNPAPMARLQEAGPLDLPFILGKHIGDRESIWVSIDGVGQLTANATWKGDAHVALVVYREGVAGYYARVDGHAGKAQLRWQVTEDELRGSRPQEWRLAVVNMAGVPIEGEIEAEFQRTIAGR